MIATRRADVAGEQSWWSLSWTDTDQPVTAADVLQMFDALRRQVAQNRHGRDGLFLGYNRLDLTLGELGADAVNGAPDDAAGWLQLRATAHVVHVRERSETVMYVAEASVSPYGRTRVIATASGVTGI